MTINFCKYSLSEVLKVSIYKIVIKYKEIHTMGMEGFFCSYITIDHLTLGQWVWSQIVCTHGVVIASISLVVTRLCRVNKAKQTKFTIFREICMGQYSLFMN